MIPCAIVLVMTSPSPINNLHDSVFFFFPPTAWKQHHSPWPEGRKCLLHQQLLCQSGGLWLQHAEPPRWDTQHVLRLSTLRRAWALSGWALCRHFCRHLGLGRDAFLYGDGNHALQSRYSGQAEEMHPGGRLRPALLGARAMPEADQGNPTTYTIWPLHSGADDGMWVAAPCGLPTGHGALQTRPILPCRERCIWAGGGSHGGKGSTRDSWNHLWTHPQQPGEGLQELHHRSLQDPAAPRSQETGRWAPSCGHTGSWNNYNQ